MPRRSRRHRDRLRVAGGPGPAQLELRANLRKIPIPSGINATQAFTTGVKHSSCPSVERMPVSLVGSRAEGRGFEPLRV